MEILTEYERGNHARSTTKKGPIAKFFDGVDSKRSGSWADRDKKQRGKSESMRPTRANSSNF